MSQVMHTIRYDSRRYGTTIRYDDTIHKVRTVTDALSVLRYPRTERQPSSDRAATTIIERMHKGAGKWFDVPPVPRPTHHSTAAQTYSMSRPGRYRCTVESQSHHRPPGGPALFTAVICRVAFSAHQHVPRRISGAVSASSIMDAR